MNSYCLAHGAMTLHLRTEVGGKVMPAAFYEQYTGEQALDYAGPRARRAARWDAAGWAAWWELVARLAAGRPVLAAVPPVETAAVSPEMPSIHLIPPAVAVRAAGTLPRGLALYLGAFAGELAAFDGEDMDPPRAAAPGLEILYRAVVTERFHRERRAILPIQAPTLFQEGTPARVDLLLESFLPFLDGRPIVLGGEDNAATEAVAAALRERGHATTVVDPLAGMERFVRAIGGLL